MIQALYQLYKKSGASTTPLEDFTTEAWVGLCKLFPEVLQQYVALLGLPSGQPYSIKTQVFYLHDALNCYVDVVLENDTTICFVENKVHSSEGWMQLDRYADVLVANYEYKQQYLIFCTKYKSERVTPNTAIQFQTITWHDIGQKIKQIVQPSVKDFYNFLKHHQMTNDLILSADLIAASTKMSQLEETFLYYLNSVKNDFWSLFPEATDTRNSITEKRQLYREDVKRHNRFANMMSHIIKDTSAYNEVIYGADFRKSDFFVGFYLDLSNPYIGLLNTEVILHNMQVITYDVGLEFRYSVSMGAFMNKEDSPELINAWFQEHFQKIRAIKENTLHLIPWK